MRKDKFGVEIKGNGIRWWPYIYVNVQCPSTYVFNSSWIDSFWNNCPILKYLLQSHEDYAVESETYSDQMTFWTLSEQLLKQKKVIVTLHSTFFLPLILLQWCPSVEDTQQFFLFSRTLDRSPQLRTLKNKFDSYPCEIGSSYTYT